jgi:hypothetical protein
MVLIGSQLKAWREFQVAKSNLTNAWGKDQKKMELQFQDVNPWKLGEENQRTQNLERIMFGDKHDKRTKQSRRVSLKKNPLSAHGDRNQFPICFHSLSC